MATSRTGTATWKRVRKQRLDHDRDAGLTRCPLCTVPLDWEYSKRPNSPEPDHIVPWAKGGQDTFENTRTICRECNQRLGSVSGRPRPVVATKALETSPIW
jgi:5-methylcytosine-specific restriction endonuclease McrA